MACEGTGEATFTSCVLLLMFLNFFTCLYYFITKLTLARPSPEMHSAAVSGVSVEPSDEFEAQTGTVVVSVLCQTNLGFDWPLKMRSVLGALPSGPKIEGAENSPAQV